MEGPPDSDVPYFIPSLGRQLTEAEINLLHSLSDGPPDQSPEWRQSGAPDEGDIPTEGQSPAALLGLRRLPEKPVTSEGELPSIDARVIAEIILNAGSDDALVLSSSKKKFRLHHGGIFVAWSKIVGPLDLTAVAFSHPIRFAGCVFFDCVTLDSARLGRVAFDSCHLSELHGNALHVDGDLDLPNSHIDGVIDIRGARIDGVLFLEGAKTNIRGVAKRALDATHARIGEDALLRRGFHANGETCLRNVNVGGHLDCAGGTFQNPTAEALVCDAARIAGNVLLKDGFCATGKVSLLRTWIGGNFRCERGSFAAPSNSRVSTLGLDLQWSRIESNLYLTEISSFRGGLDLRDAHTKGFADDGTAHPQPGTLRLSGFRYDTFADGPEAFGSKGRTKTGWRDRFDWLMLQPPELVTWNLDPQPFVQVANVLHTMGHYDDARIILQQRETLWLRHVPNKLWILPKWLIRVALWILAGHGYQSLRAFLFLLPLWMIGAVVFEAAYERGLLVPSHSESSATQLSNGGQTDLSGFSPWRYSLDVLVPILNLGEEKDWTLRNDTADPSMHARPLNHMLPAWFGGRPDESVNKGHAALTLWDAVVDRGGARNLRVGFIVCGWLLSFIAAVGFTGLLQRDRFGGASNPN